MIFDPSIEEFFQKLGQPKKLKRGDSLFSMGEVPHYLYLVRTGLLGSNILAESGSELLVRLFAPGQLVGHRALLVDEKYHSNAIALQDSLVLSVEKELAVESLQKNSKFCFSVLKMLGKELAFTENRMMSLTEKDVTARVAEALIYLRELYPDYKWTRKEIAEFCASTAPTVIKVMAKLEEEGYISQKGREFHIIDREGLLQVCQCEP